MGDFFIISRSSVYQRLPLIMLATHLYKEFIFIQSLRELLDDRVRNLPSHIFKPTQEFSDVTLFGQIELSCQDGIEYTYYL